MFPTVSVLLLAALPPPALLLSAPLAGQTVRGRVLDHGGKPVEAALLRLLGASGDPQAVTLSGPNGAFTLEAPGPGVYVIEGEKPGWEPYRSAEVDLPRADGVYGVDLLVSATPIALEGLTVTADAQERVRRSLRRLTGVNPHSLRYTPILRERIVRSLERGHDVPDMLRSLVLPGIVMEDFPPSPPCVRFRSRGCLAVHLDGVPVPATFVRDLPLEAVEAVLVVGDKEMIQYPGGAVLLYTAGWLGANR